MRRPTSITRTEFMLEVRFEDSWGAVVKRRRSSMAGIRKFLTLIGPEPWKAYLRPGDGPDDRRCCSGAECGCGGATYREEAEAYRKAKHPDGFPAIKSVKVFARKVTRTAWEPSAL